MNAYEIPTWAIVQAIAKRAARDAAKASGGSVISDTSDGAMNLPTGSHAESDEVEMTGRVFRSARDIADALIEYRRRDPPAPESVRSAGWWERKG